MDRLIFIDNITGAVVGDSAIFPSDVQAAAWDMSIAAALVTGDIEHRFAYLTGPGIDALVAGNPPGIRVHEAAEGTPGAWVDEEADPAVLRLPALTEQEIEALPLRGFLWCNDNA